jgi:hypothetical protein
LSRRWVLGALLAGCGGVRAGEGLEAAMRVAGGAPVEGDLLRAVPEGGPAVVSVLDSRPEVFPGQRDKPLRGTLAAEATAAALALAGDGAYWLVTAGVPDLDAPGLPTFTGALSFAPALPPGPHQIVVRAVDAAGRFGPPAISPLAVTTPPRPAGALAVSLRWDTEADLDLHVVDPAGVEIWAHNINSTTAPPPGGAPDPQAWQAGGQLDFDSNAGCRIDGRREENVVWRSGAPAGHYVVRVEAASLCGQVTARWTVEVFAGSAQLGRAQGQSLDSDERLARGAGGGVTALEVDLAR